MNADKGKKGHIYTPTPVQWETGERKHMPNAEQVDQQPTV